ncbi:DNA cytosine methyltransferase [Patulibacter brassicae]|uniref:Cytosine-specific methyltransferase n=1 Tax=Patulibacter brassicae TaxID=1705717 RepID=A0ABU4VMF2_9ACTN|nr:DNA cytosine methyltransferase [Patulibacter brassicae]MDX8152073.1 DNA cytosine methyltransferase [Patulibacter brassicae]
MTFRVVDLFAGCGGMTLGFEATGRFRSIFAVEFERPAAATYARNFGEHVAAKPIELVEEFPATDVLIGGPPCQGFSPLNMRGVGLERRDLWREYLRALDQSAPSVFVMENVPELLRSAEYLAFREAATELGYQVDGRILNAADYGVPQRRRRAIVIGSRVGDVVWPAPTHSQSGEDGSPRWRTFRDAVAGLPLEPDGHNWHRSRNPRPISIERYKTIPGEGEGRFDLAQRRPDITPACWLRKPTGSTDVFGRLWWDRPAFTIRTEFYKPEKGRYLHPSEHRPITLREAARCMTFPDEFAFPEDQGMTAVAKQIGNAVPPRLAEHLAQAIAAMLDAGDEVARQEDRQLSLVAA